MDSDESYNNGPDNTTLLDLRPAGKAGDPDGGGWYNDDADGLNEELDDFLSKVPSTIDGYSLPIPGARIIIAPKRCLGLQLLGPQQGEAGIYPRAISFSLVPRLQSDQIPQMGDPLGDLTVDQDILQRIKQEGQLHSMKSGADMNEHSLELHAPYIYKRFEQTFGSPDNFPKIAPIIVGSIGRTAQKEFGRLLLPYFKDTENAFVISSDFCHWGWYFPYMPYSPDRDIKHLTALTKHSPKPSGAPIHEVIEAIDKHSMDAVESGSQDAFVDSIKLTDNTVCGRHPIGIAMAALELYGEEINESRFKVVKYDRSELVDYPSQSSVSYVSAYAIL
ncbi:Protein MEMO1 [Cladobotryum mycophilum]|uniref:Protein MEMO1 n=1 Tax=Cladobotryum mycophilum TaxID=491253 RepID=A0ABR0SM37_9HYPO